jgi:hypothetical protein
MKPAVVIGFAPDILRLNTEAAFSAFRSFGIRFLNGFRGESSRPSTISE